MYRQQEVTRPHGEHGAHPHRAVKGSCSSYSESGVRGGSRRGRTFTTAHRDKATQTTVRAETVSGSESPAPAQHNKVSLSHKCQLSSRTEPGLLLLSRKNEKMLFPLTFTAGEASEIRISFVYFFSKTQWLLSFCRLLQIHTPCSEDQSERRFVILLLFCLMPNSYWIDY